jgi:hypothetical protein
MTTATPNHAQTAITALTRLYRETNTIGDTRRIPVDVAALRLLAYADLIRLIENRESVGATTKAMMDALSDWEDQTYESRALLTLYQCKAERAAIIWIRKTYFLL